MVQLGMFFFTPVGHGAVKLGCFIPGGNGAVKLGCFILGGHGAVKHIVSFLLGMV